MKYVIDASVAAIWVLRAPLTSKALQLRDDYQRHAHDLIAPAHFPQEIASALTKAERQRLIPVGDARRLIQDVLGTAPILHALDPLFYRRALCRTAALRFILCRTGINLGEKFLPARLRVRHMARCRVVIGRR